MTTAYTVILNPFADRGRTGQKRQQVEAALAQAGLTYTLVETAGPNDAIALAQTAVQNGRIPIAAGGDGTISEVVNGMLKASDGAATGPIGLLPLGTANDLTDMLQIPRDLQAAVAVIARGYTRKIDVGRVNGRYFDNNSAIGLEPQVNIANTRMPFFKGDIRYIIATVWTILRNFAWQADITWDDGHYNGSMVLVSVGNTQRTGGAFFMTPDAEPDDGLLDFVFGPAMSRLALLGLLLKVFKGTHTADPRVQVHRTKTLTIRTETGTPAHADGEIIATDATEITWDILPQALEVFVP